MTSPVKVCIMSNNIEKIFYIIIILIICYLFSGKRLSMSYFCPPNDLKTVVETLRDVSGKTPDKFGKYSQRYPD